MITKNLIGKQCVFAKHFKKSRNRRDALLVREILHFDDGSKEPVVKMVYEPKRQFYVTKKPYRNHKQKKTIEKRDKLMQYDCTDSDLPEAVAKALEKPYERRGLRELAKSPYLYNTDYSISNIYKRKYINKYPDVANNFLEVCNFDIETSTEFYNEHLARTDPNYKNPEEIKIITMDMGSKHYIGVTERYLGEHLGTDWKGRYMELVKEHIWEDMKDSDIEIISYQTERELIVETFRRLHQWNPDILAIWNKI